MKGRTKKKVTCSQGTGYLLHVVRMLGCGGARVLDVLGHRTDLPLLHDLESRLASARGLRVWSGRQM